MTLGLQLDQSDYCVVGGCALTARGFRPATDIDLVVTEAVYDALRDLSWTEETYKPTAGRPKRLLNGRFDVGTRWGKRHYRPDPRRLIDEAELVDGVPVIPLREVLSWKVQACRSKDYDDIRTIFQVLFGPPGG